jgi:phosphoribosylaminoimidazolecarboxamide formyltransferase/IMP cyclohydrolase
MKPIRSALISVYHKDGLEPLLRTLAEHGTTLYSTGGTQQFIESLGLPVVPVETLTGYPSILDGRVKTLHPKIFGGILARRDPGHLGELRHYEIPEIDLVVVDLYPFEETVAQTAEESAIIEKIDIGGISLIRAAAKNFHDVAIVADRSGYPILLHTLQAKNGCTELSDRQTLARRAFAVSSHYDTAIYRWFDRHGEGGAFKQSLHGSRTLRYGENPHQSGTYYGHLEELFDIHEGKELSFNNLVDIDAAVNLMREFLESGPTFAILKHTNACGVATRPTLQAAWDAALAADPVSAFGGVFVCNREVDLETATAINQLFYEVLIAPGFTPEAKALLAAKKNRILLQIKHWAAQPKVFKSILNGVIEHDADLRTETEADLRTVTLAQPDEAAKHDLLFALKCAKHLKSNAIVLVKNEQLLGMGCGQTSRVDALQQAIHKARHFGFELAGAVMASEAFFPFPDCVEIAHGAGIAAVAQPGGSIKDADSIAYCDAHGLAMVLTGVRHFKH